MGQGRCPARFCAATWDCADSEFVDLTSSPSDNLKVDMAATFRRLPRIWQDVRDLHASELLGLRYGYVMWRCVSCAAFGYSKMNHVIKVIRETLDNRSNQRNIAGSD